MRDIPQGHAARYNAAPTDEVLVVEKPEGCRQATMARWGARLSKTRDARTINLRAETIERYGGIRRMFGVAWEPVLQVATGYIEWRGPAGRGTPRQPVLFEVDSGHPFAFASLATRDLSPDGHLEAVIITCASESNPVASEIHHRMPVILADPDQHAAWLEHDPASGEGLALLTALPTGRLTSRPVNPALNKAGVPEGPHLLERPFEQQTLV